MTSKVPHPGSPEAFKQGCKCAIIDNHYGAGYWGDGHRYGWCVTIGCPIHDEKDALPGRLQKAEQPKGGEW